MYHHTMCIYNMKYDVRTDCNLQERIKQFPQKLKGPQNLKTFSEAKLSSQTVPID